LMSVISSLWHLVLRVFFFPLSTIFPPQLVVENVIVPIEDLPKRLESLKIVHLTDFHWDFVPIRMTETLMNQVVENTNNAQPNIILLTGDYVQFNPKAIEELVDRWLSKLKSTHGIFAVLGNHDHKAKSISMIISTLEKAGIKVLQNKSIILSELELEIAGVGDLHSGVFHPEKVFPSDPSLDHNKTRICMSHNPYSATQLSQWRINLILSGHTHGRQIVIPGFGSLIATLKTIHDILPKKLQRWIIIRRLPYLAEKWSWAQGLHAVKRKSPLKGDNYLYTSRGLATHPPLRLFCDPEVTVISLVPAKL